MADKIKPAGADNSISYGDLYPALTPPTSDPRTTNKATKRALKDEYGTANLKKIEKMRSREALADAAEYGRKAEAQEARLNDPRFMAEKMAEARRAAVADLSRAPTGGQQAELARAALGGGDARRVAEVARQSSRGQAEATAQAAAQQGFQAGQAAAAAERAMLDQLRQRQNALLATAGEPPTTFAETTGQQIATQAAAGIIPAAAEYGATVAAKGGDNMKAFGSALGEAYVPKQPIIGGSA